MERKFQNRAARTCAALRRVSVRSPFLGFESFRHQGKLSAPSHNLAKLAAKKRLAASIYYSWSGHKGVVESQEAIFRCGALTKTGAVVLKPF